MPEIYSTYERKNTHRRTHQTKTERQRPYHIMACQKDKLRSQQFLQKIEKQQHREIDLLFRISEILQEDFLPVIRRCCVVKFTTKTCQINNRLGSILQHDFLHIDY